MHVVDFYPLPDELLTIVCRFVGVVAAVPSLLSSTRFHSAWQRAVKSLTIYHEEITNKDIHIIKKYTGLKSLSLSHLTGPLSPWLLVGQLAPSLTQLTKLDVCDIDEAFSILKTIHFSEGLRTRLQHLSLDNHTYKLQPGDLSVLKDLPALASLDLTYLGSDCSEDKLPDFTGSFKSLRAMTMTLAEEAQLEAHVLSLFPGSITSLRSLHLLVEDDLDDAGGDQTLCDAFSRAFSRLANLEQLHVTYFPKDTAVQQQFLMNLSKLTELHVTPGPQRLTVPESLQDLHTLFIHRAIADASVFSLSSLEYLTAAYLDIDASWNAKVADGCPLKELNIEGFGHDEMLQNLPTLPQLQTLKVYGLMPSNGGYSHLASVLRRHAGTLRTVVLATTEGFEEGLPRELPVCTFLRMVRVKKQTLQLLSVCCLPALEVLLLDLADNNVGVRSDLWWLKELPSLTRLQLHGSSADQRTAVAQLLAPRIVEMS